MIFVVDCALNPSLRSFAEENQNLVNNYAQSFITGVPRQPFDGFLAMTTKKVGI